MNIKQFFKGRTVGFYLSLGAGAVMLIADILFIALDFGDRTFSLVTFFAVLVGAAAAIAHALLPKLEFLPLVSAALYGVGMGMHLYLGLPTLSDVVNEVNFVGGNPTMVIAFGIIFLLCLVCAVASCFLAQSKPERTATE